MRLLTFGMFVVTFLTACASSGMQGRIDKGKYLAPNGKIAFAAPNLGGPQHAARDIYVANLDRGFFEETDAFGLQGMYYTSRASLGVSQPLNPDERRSTLNKALTNFAMPNIFLAVSPNAEVVHREFVIEHGNEVLVALVRLPGLSGAFDVKTNKKFDAYPAVLVLAEGEYLVVLRVQSNITDARPLDPKDKASHYLGGLRKLQSGLEVKE